MKIFDGHCDVLYKMWSRPEHHSFYESKSLLDVRYSYLEDSNVSFQVFAVFVPDSVSHSQRFEVALKQIDLFYEKIIQDGSRIRLATSSKEISFAQYKYAFLALEGAGVLQGELSYLRHFYRLGVRQVGLTWNFSNEVADGIHEERGGGLTRFGRSVVKEIAKLGMIVDLSHLSIKGFWEVIETPGLPIIASHSNARSVCSHIRNLEDDQIEALIQRKGLIGITFVPQFLSEKAATIDDILIHLEHICTLGGEDYLFFGSDFDGITTKVQGLEKASDWENLIEKLIKYFPDSMVKKWVWENACQYYSKQLA